ncbi:FecR family protein [Undibacterium sp. Rencai35W]|uniref:FecR family protein n=1 Tax=Undibacterium sp. Rencai35W TaxID=3413046 RepID=UPI003BF08C17
MKRHITTLIHSIILLAATAAASAYADDAGRIVFVSGKAELGGQPVALNSTVSEGAELSTGADGYLYLKTVDNGFFILRPNSRARIVAYHIDAKDPANTRIKLELVNGVARSISGDAVKQARQNFRFNTPVAAIGVRGTDFTVYTTQDTSRVAVISGGIVVSGFVSGCAPQGNGPCEGSASAELFARQQGQLLQITKGQVKPQLLQSNGAAPDIIAPPRPDEPNGKNASATGPAPAVPGANELNLDPKKGDELKQAITSANNTSPVVTPPVVVPPVVPPVVNQIIWGRWTEVLGQPAKLDFVKLSGEAKTIAIVDNFALFQVKGTEWQIPNTGSMGFALKDSEAYVKDEAKGVMSAAQVQNASLNVNFAKATFVTNFDLQTNIGTYKLNSNGSVDSKGQFSNDNIFTSNASVQGVLTSENGGSAAYLFRARLDDTHLATGATLWAKK